MVGSAVGLVVGLGAPPPAGAAPASSSPANDAGPAVARVNDSQRPGGTPSQPAGQAASASAETDTFELRTELVLARPLSFVRQTQAQQQVRRRLLERSALHSRIEFRRGQLRFQPDPRTPAGRWSFHLDGHRLGLVGSDGSEHLLPRSALPAALDGAGYDGRRHFHDEHTGAFDLRTGPPMGRTLTDELRVNAPIRLSRGPKSEQALRLLLKATAPQSADHVPYCHILPRHQLGGLMLPLLPWPAGAALVARINCSLAPPLAFALTIDAGASSDTPPTFRSTVSRSWTQKRWGAALLRSKSPTETDVPTPTRPGFQAVPAGELMALRATAGASVLTIDNRSSRAALIYLDGVLLGWTAAYREFRFHCPAPGFYRVYATSPTGAAYWGPFDMYLPGTRTLR